MPTLRKVSADEAVDRAVGLSTPTPEQIHALLAVHAAGDARGLTRIDLAGEHAWRGRVYTGGGEIHKQFSDGRYGGPEGALLAALAWRNQQREQVGPPPERKAPSVRIVRAEGRRNCGWLAYTPGGRRYFADGKHGGSEAAYQAAAAWVREQTGE